MPFILNLDALVAKLDLDRPMYELISQLTAHGREAYLDRGESLPFDFDSQCRRAIRKRRGNPVPLSTKQVTAHVVEGSVPPDKARKARSKTASSTVQTSSPALPIVKRLRQLRGRVLASRIQGEQLKLMPARVSALKQIFGLDNHHRSFGGNRILVANGIAHITSFIQSGEATPDQVQQAERLLEMHN